MHSAVCLYRIRCPACGTEQVGFIGNNEDGSFYCNAPITVFDRQGVSSIAACGESWEKIRHMPEGNLTCLKCMTAKEMAKHE